MPSNSKDYIHRVGRTARAGKAGISITVVTQYDVEMYQNVESNLGGKLPSYPIDQDVVMSLVEQVSQAVRNATTQCRTNEEAQKKNNGLPDQKGKKKKKKF